MEKEGGKKKEEKEEEKEGNKGREAKPESERGNKREGGERMSEERPVTTLRLTRIRNWSTEN